MKKKLILILLILILSGSIGIVYLNNVLLPTKIKSLIINTLQEKTQKRVTLRELRFSIFKGLVLKDLKVYDSGKTILSIKEGSCLFLIPPIFTRRIIIPLIKIKSPEIFLERRQDNTFNLQDLFTAKTAQAQKTKFSFFVYKFKLVNGRINFQDDTFAQPFTKTLDNFNLTLSLSLPDRLKFNFKAEIPATPLIHIDSSGEFRIMAHKLSAKISIHDFSAGEFFAYYRSLGINIGRGKTDALLDLKLENNILYVGMAAQSRDLVVSRDKISAELNSGVKAVLQYGLEDKMLKFSGEVALSGSRLSGLQFVGEASAINGKFTFNNAGIFSDRLSADIWGIPVLAKINLADFSNPLLNINVSSSLNLDSLRQILKDRFKLAFPGQIKGLGNLSLDIRTRVPSAGALSLNGYLDIPDALIKFEKVSSPFEGIKGRLEFSQNQLRWSDFNFKYSGVPYTTSGILTDFHAPGVQLELSSSALSLQSNFAINDNLVSLSKLSGKYLNSEFSLTGNIDTGNLPALETDISGDLNVDLQDIKEPLKKFREQLEKLRPQGLMHVQFNLNGDINNFKSCSLQAKLSGSSISMYGLKSDEFLLNYSQSSGLADIPLIHLSLYGGTLDATAKMNLNSGNLPYWLSADIQGVKIEKLKLDTEAKGKDIAGTIAAGLKINGFSSDLSRLNGEGRTFISEGKLWQLNLFKGLGSLLFAKDFANIIFNEGSCGFSIQDKYIFTDNLKLKSNIANLSGPVKIGFDGSLEASLNVEVLDEMAPLSGTFKDVTTAIVGQAGRFGIIKVSGTLKEPKYKFQPAVADILKGLKDVIFGK
jgi:hypothetical protein